MLLMLLDLLFALLDIVFVSDLGGKYVEKNF